jgi:hypothetical protein
MNWPPCGLYRDLEFTDHHFSGPDMWVLHPSPSGGCILPEWDVRVPRTRAWPVILQKTWTVHEARNLCPGRTELRPVRALTARAAVFFGGSWAPERGARARWVQERFLPRPWVGRPTAALLPAPLLCRGRSERNVGNSESVASIIHARSRQGSLFVRVSFTLRSRRVNRSRPLPDRI